MDFRQLYSEKWGVSADQFERKLFSKCLFRHAVPCAWLLQRWSPDFFREDYELLRDVASARNTDEVLCEVNRFFGRNARDKSILRTGFYLRISGKRVLQVYRSLTREAEAAGEPGSESLPVV